MYYNEEERDMMIAKMAACILVGIAVIAVLIVLVVFLW